MRSKTRTLLTTIGIIIGISTMVALGSISEGLRSQISEALESAGGLIYVYEESDQPLFLAMGTSRLSEDKIEEIESVEGIEESARFVMDFGYLDEDQQFGQPDLFINGIDPEDEELLVTENAELDDGETLEAGDTYSATIGYNLAQNLDVDVGDTIELKEENFIIKGVYKKFGDPGLDDGVLIPIEIALDLLETEDYSGIIIYPEDIDDVEEITDYINENIDGVTALSTEDVANSVSGIIDQVQVFTLGIAGVSALVGGLGVLNTMIMSVMERKREIGIMKAVGGTNSCILRQILIESVVITFLGGVAGIILGSLGAYSLRFLSSSLESATVTPSLAIGSLMFAIFLGLVGGYYPAVKASKLDPIEAIKYE
jgi:putative ABC transport system permease protein